MADNKSKKASKKKSGITIQIVLCIAALAAIAFMTVRICRLGIIPLRMYATLAAVLTACRYCSFCGWNYQIPQNGLCMYGNCGGCSDYADDIFQ